MNKLISVIVPVYNAEKYLKECVESLINQTYINLEIILINDGSTDNSIQICNEYADYDSRIIVVDKLNEGVSKTRNLGIEIAKGDFITFVDSDDYIDLSMYEKLMIKAETENSDMVFCGYNYFKNGKIIPVNEPQLQLTVTDESYLKNFFVLGENRVMGSSCRQMTKSNLVKECRFNSEICFAEDLVFIISLLKHAKNISVIDEKLYFYRVLSGVEHKYADEKYVRSHILLGEIFYKQLKDMGQDRLAEFMLYQEFIGVWHCYIFNKKNDLNLKKRLKNDRQIFQMKTKKGLQIYVEDETNKKHKLLGKLVYFKMYGIARFLVRINILINKLLKKI